MLAEASSHSKAEDTGAIHPPSQSLANMYHRKASDENENDDDDDYDAAIFRGGDDPRVPLSRAESFTGFARGSKTFFVAAMFSKNAARQQRPPYPRRFLQFKFLFFF